jgi:phosphohistidine swiveling domain-containing protein
MDTYFKTWGFKNTQEYFTDYYPVRGDFEDLYLFFKKGNWYGKYNIKYFGYVMLDYFVDKKNFEGYLAKKKILKQEIEDLWHSTSREKISGINTKEQLKLVQDCLTMMVRSFVIDPFAPMIGEMAPDYTNWWLEQKKVPESERKSAFHLLFASEDVSETIRRQLIIKDKIEQAADEADRSRIIKELAKTFAFAKAEFSGYLPYTEEDVLKEYEAVKQIQLHTEEEKEAKKKLLESLSATPQEKDIFYLFGYCQYSRDERKEYLQKLMTLADWCLEELSKKHNISIDWLRSALVGELTEEKLQDKDFIELLERRYVEGIAMYWDDCQEGKYVVGEEGEKLFNSIDNKAIDSVEMKGQPTFYGKVTGIVKIISDPKMKVPDEPFVLVTGMTSPDFIHFMQKCVAIVTDEGGITSHAAILSRELKKPCIVGVKIARKTLKDGDKVEVDADKGIVRIIK